MAWDTKDLDRRKAGSQLEAAPSARLLINHGMPVRFRTIDLTGRALRRAEAAEARQRAKAAKVPPRAVGAKAAARASGRT